MTFLKLSFSSLCILTNSAYKVLGVDPVERPSTHFSFFFCFSRMKSAICFATALDPALRSGYIFTGIFSNESTIVMLASDLGLNLENTELIRYHEDERQNCKYANGCLQLVY